MQTGAKAWGALPDQSANPKKFLIILTQQKLQFLKLSSYGLELQPKAGRRLHTSLHECLESLQQQHLKRKT